MLTVHLNKLPMDGHRANWISQLEKQLLLQVLKRNLIVIIIRMIKIIIIIILNTIIFFFIVVDVLTCSAAWTTPTSCLFDTLRKSEMLYELFYELGN